MTVLEMLRYPDVRHGVGFGRGLICEAWFDEVMDFWRQQRKESNERKEGKQYDEKTGI